MVLKKTLDWMVNHNIKFWDAVFIMSIPLTAASGLGAFGTRSTETIHAFNYQGKPGVVKHADVRFGPDNYWVETYDSNKTRRKILTDNGKVIEFGIGFLDFYNPFNAVVSDPPRGVTLMEGSPLGICVRVRDKYDKEK